MIIARVTDQKTSGALAPGDPCAPSVGLWENMMLA
jgi:hypothetical protein